MPIQKTELLKDGRKAKGLTIQQVSDATGIPLEYVERLESGKSTSPSAHALYKLASLYEIDLKELLIGFGVIIKKPNQLSDNIPEEKLPLDYSISKLFWGIPVQQAFEIGGYIDGVVESVRQTGQIECEFRDKIIEDLKAEVEKWKTEVIRLEGTDLRLKESHRYSSALFTITKDQQAELESLRKERESYRGALEKLKGWTFATSDAVHSVITNTLAKYPTEQTDKPRSHE